MKIVLIFLSFFLTFELSAQQVAGSDAVFQNIVREYILNDDGSIEYHYYKKLKLNTHFAFNRLYGETFIVYNPNFQTLKINKAVTIMADGTHVKVPENAFNEVLPRMATKAPSYNHLREMVVTHTGLEVGATIELEYTLISKAGYFPGLMENILLTESSPVEKEVIRVKVPTDVELAYHVYNLRTGPEIKDAKGKKEYIFTFSALAENTHEQHQPTQNHHLPRLVFSTNNYSNMLTQLTEQDAFDLKTNAAMEELVKTAKGKSNNDMELVLALQKKVNQNMNTWNIHPEYSGYKIRTPLETWKSNGGTPFEKSLLLVALLRNAGLNAQCVLVFPSQLYDEKTACLSLASGILVMASPREREQMFVSAYHTSDQNHIFSLNEKTIVYVDRKEIKTEIITDKFENKVVNNGMFSLSDDFKLTGSMECLLSEHRNPYYSIMEDSSKVKSFVGGGLSNKDILESTIINSAQFRTLVEYKIESKEALKNQSKYYFWEIPENKQGTTGWHISYLNSERNSPLELPYPLDEQYSFTLTLPQGIVLVNPLELISIKAPFGELVLSTVQNENKVIVKRMFVINTNTISESDYQQFKEMFDLWNEKNFRKLVFRK